MGRGRARGSIGHSSKERDGRGEVLEKVTLEITRGVGREEGGGAEF